LGDRVDGRSREGRFLTKCERELVAQVGGAPSFTQKLLIRRLSRGMLRPELLDEKLTARTRTDHDARTFGGLSSMLFCNHGSSVLTISQPAHAWISGQLLRAWAEPLGEPLLLGAEQHDIGWLDWEAAPTFDRRRCHTNLDRRGVGFGRPAELQAAVAARHVRSASSLRTRSVGRDVR
jgi:hypothetical protein